MAIYKSALFGVCIWGVSALTAPSGVSAQGRAELKPTTEIPRSYKSWSLFLVCNPAWIVKNGDRGLTELYYQFKAFGDVIGDKNLAIWFWKERRPEGEGMADNTDIGRSAV